MNVYERTLKKVYINMTIITMTSILLSLEGCNTMEGAGEDIQKAGKSLENAAARNKDNSTPPMQQPITRSRKVNN